MENFPSAVVGREHRCTIGGNAVAEKARLTAMRIMIGTAYAASPAPALAPAREAWRTLTAGRYGQGGDGMLSAMRLPRGFAQKGT